MIKETLKAPGSGWTQRFKEGALNVLKGGAIMTVGFLLLPAAVGIAVDGVSTSVGQIVGGL